MKMISLLVVAVALVVSGTSARASAATPEELQQAQEVAHRVYPLERWPAVREGGLSEQNAATSAEAEAAWRGCLDLDLRCEVRYAPGFVERASFPRLCSVTVHEWGHLAGWWVAGGPTDGQHSPDSSSNMYFTAPHHPACGLSDEQREGLEARRDELSSRLSDLLVRARKIRRGCRSARGRCRARAASASRRSRACRALLASVIGRLEARP